MFPPPAARPPPSDTSFRMGDIMHNIESDDIICPERHMIYEYHTAEISADDLYGDNWDDSYGENVQEDIDDGVIIPPPGWEIFDWETHAHKDAAGIVSIYLSGGKCDVPDCQGTEKPPNYDQGDPGRGYPMFPPPGA